MWSLGPLVSWSLEVVMQDIYMNILSFLYISYKSSSRGTYESMVTLLEALALALALALPWAASVLRYFSDQQHRLIIIKTVADKQSQKLWRYNVTKGVGTTCGK